MLAYVDRVGLALYYRRDCLGYVFYNGDKLVVRLICYCDDDYTIYPKVALPDGYYIDFGLDEFFKFKLNSSADVFELTYKVMNKLIKLNKINKIVKSVRGYIHEAEMGKVRR